MVDSSSAGRGLFSFQNEKEDRSEQPRTASISDVLELPQAIRDSSTSGRVQVPSEKRRWFNPEMLEPQPSPTVARSYVSSQALRRKGGTAERIQKSLQALDDVVQASTLTSPSSSIHNSTSGRLALHTRAHGSLFKVQESQLQRADATTTSAPMSTHDQFDTFVREPDPTLSHLSIMDESGMTKELFMAPTPSRTLASPHEWDTIRPGDSTFLGETLLQQADRTTLDDPATRCSTDLICSFHKMVVTYPNPADTLELAYSLEQCCDAQLKQLQEAEERTKCVVSPKVVTDLNLELSTWQLLRALFSDRIEREREDMMIDAIVSGLSDKEIVDDYFLKNSTVREAQLVVDWLEKNAQSSLERYPVKVNYFADAVKWENTLHDIEHQIGMGYIVAEMDPDAPVRQGKHLSELDEKDEQSLIRHLFTCIRAGQVAKAQELCLQCGQAWRAVTLEGWQLYHDPNISKSMSEEMDLIEGNSSRDLWKISCWELANNPHYSVHEKALYSALSGNLRHLLPACQSWFDYVWAYFKVMVDVLTEQKLRGSPRLSGRSLEDLPAEYFTALTVPEEIFQEIEATSPPLIKKQSLEHFHTVQKFAIINDFEGLVSAMHEWLKDSLTIHLLRFMAHVVLFIQGLDMVADDERCADIVEAYVKELIRSRFISLVALYAARLPLARQVTCYSQLLEGIDNVEDQRKCLELGKEAGLDTAVITKAVVENIRDVGMEVTLDSSVLELGSEVQVTKVDRSKIQVINWLVFEESQRAEAIRQGNALIRAFLAMRKYTAAREVYSKIPLDSVEVVTRNWQGKMGDTPLPVDVRNDIKEYHCLQSYLVAVDAFNAWNAHFHLKKLEPPVEPASGHFKQHVTFEHRQRQYQIELEHRSSQLKLLTEDAEQKLYNVLLFVGGQWMVDDLLLNQPDAARSRQLCLLRQLCLPQVCFLLHTVLHGTRQYRKCLQLADIVVSEKQKLYKEFTQEELQKILGLLQRSALEMVDDQQCDELGYLLV